MSILFWKKKEEEGRFRKGEKVSFFQGRRPMIGTIESIQDDGRIAINANGQLVVKDDDEVRPYSELKGKAAKIRFLPPTSE